MGAETNRSARWSSACVGYHRSTGRCEVVDVLVARVDGGSRPDNSVLVNESVDCLNQLGTERAVVLWSERVEILIDIGRVLLCKEDEFLKACSSFDVIVVRCIKDRENNAFPSAGVVSGTVSRSGSRQHLR